MFQDLLGFALILFSGLISSAMIRALEKPTPSPSEMLWLGVRCFFYFSLTIALMTAGLLLILLHPHA